MTRSALRLDRDHRDMLVLAVWLALLWLTTISPHTIW